MLPSIVGEAVHQSLVTANALGFGDKYVPSLIEAQEKLAGVPSSRADVASLPPGGGTQASDADDAAFAAFALEAAIAAGEAILPHFRAPLDVEDKGGARGYDPVTEADRAAEAVIRAAITSRYPDHGIHGEEHGRLQGRSRFTWVVDPIDGTRSFIVGHLHWATLIALNDGDRPRVGVTHQPFVGESFVAVNGTSTWMRGDERRALRTRRCPRIEDAVVARPIRAISRLIGKCTRTLRQPTALASFATAATAIATRRWRWDSSTSPSKPACKPTTSRRSFR